MCWFLLSGAGGLRLERPAARVAEMHAPYVDRYVRDMSSAGLTFKVDDHGGQTMMWHDSLISTCEARLVLLPETGFALVLLMNRHANKFAEHITDIVLDRCGFGVRPSALRGTFPNDADRALWSGYERTYIAIDQADGLVRVSRRRVDGFLGEQLEAVFHEQDGPVPVALRRVRHDLYADSGGNGDAVLGFVPPAAGPDHRSRYLYVNGTLCLRVDDELHVPEQDDLWAFKGHYTAANGSLTSRVENGRLMVKSSRREMECVCLPYERGAFASKIGMLEFQANGDGTWHRVRLARGILFTRNASSLATPLPDTPGAINSNTAHPAAQPRTEG